MSHELVVRGGTVIDGTGAPAREADIGIDSGRITEIGVGLRGDEVLDATDHVVAPGFIDLHTHYDAQVLWDPEVRPSSHLGVTSVVLGNCGFSVAPCPPDLRPSLMRTLEGVEDMRFATLDAGIEWDFETYPEYLAAVARRGPSINVGGYVGHTPARLWVMGDEAYEREATPEEIQQICEVVIDSIRGGALGFSSDRTPFHRGDGGRRVPSAVATQEELETIWRAVGELGHGLIHVAPGEDYQWIYDVQPQVGAPVTWSAILAYPDDAISKASWRDKLAHHATGAAAGAVVRPQVSCRPTSFQMTMAEPSTLYSVPAFGDLMAASVDERAALYRDDSWRRLAASEIDSGRYVDVRWDRMVVAETGVPGIAGRTVTDLARERGVAPFDVVLDIALTDDLDTRFQIKFANDDVDAVTALLRAPGCVLGLSDAGAHIGQICDAIMPLDYLSNWVRDRGTTTPEAGVHHLTGELSDLIGLDDRGHLRPGSAADLVVLDWDRLATGPIDRVTDFPGEGERLTAEAPVGLRHVLVNGVAIRRDEEQITPPSAPGQILSNRSLSPL